MFSYSSHSLDNLYQTQEPQLESPTIKIEDHLSCLKEIDIKDYKINWRLFFTTIPTVDVILKMYKETQNQCNDQQLLDIRELQILQFLLISIQAPFSIQLSTNKWKLIQQLMPIKRTIEELKVMVQQFFYQSAYVNPWTECEDSMLTNIVIDYQNRGSGSKWSKISQELQESSNQQFIRTAKQCRERWGNKLDPTINNGEWVESEDLNFLKELLKTGRRWAELSNKLAATTNFGKRTEFALKHRFSKLITKMTLTAQSLKIAKSQSKYKIKYISSDWNSKEILKIQLKIEQLEKNLEKSQNYDLIPLLKKIQLEKCQLCIIQKSKIQKLGLPLVHFLVGSSSQQIHQ